MEQVQLKSSLSSYGIVAEVKLTPDLRKILYKWLEPAVEQSGGRYSMFDVLQHIESGHYKLWSAVHLRTGEICGVMVGSISNYPGAKYFTGQFLGGTDLRRWKAAMIQVVRDYAVLNGCVTKDGFPLVEFSGRKGRESMLAPNG